MVCVCVCVCYCFVWGVVLFLTERRNSKLSGYREALEELEKVEEYDQNILCGKIQNKIKLHVYVSMCIHKIKLCMFLCV